jgi:hypothetical protein
MRPESRLGKRVIGPEGSTLPFTCSEITAIGFGFRFHLLIFISKNIE